MVNSAPPPVAAAALLLLAVGGCSAGDGPSTSGSTTGSPVPQAASTALPAGVNETDLAYAHELGALHEQAVTLAAMIGDKDVSAEVRAVAAEIGRTRSAELAELNALLAAWGAEPHPADFHGNPGEMTARELSELYALAGPDFERQWLERMVANHHGSVAMSRAEVDHGGDMTARETARRLATAHQERMDQLQQLRS